MFSAPISNNATNFDAVATPKYLKQGRLFPSDLVPAQKVDAWSSEGALTRTQLLRNGFGKVPNDWDEDAVLAAGAEQTIALFRKHRQTYITDTDFEAMSKAGLKIMRVPLGWWAFPTYPLAKTEEIVSDMCYPDNKLVTIGSDMLMATLNAAKEGGIQLLLDLHAMPCGQSDGTYNGIFPEPPIFWEREDAKDYALEVITNMLSWYSDLPSDMQDVIHGFTLVNEPAHLLPQYKDQVVDWLGNHAVPLFSRHFQGYPNKYLYVNLIETMLTSDQPDRIQQLAQVMQEIGLSGKDWAVLDVHRYFAWDPKFIALGCEDCDKLVEYTRSDMANFTGNMVKYADMFDVRNVATSEWSLSFNNHDSRGCYSCRQSFYQAQVDAFKAAGMAQFFWGWKMPFGGVHEAYWSQQKLLYP
jgi:hypothetical protein